MMVDYSNWTDKNTADYEQSVRDRPENEVDLNEGIANIVIPEQTTTTNTGNGDETGDDDSTFVPTIPDLGNSEITQPTPVDVDFDDENTGAVPEFDIEESRAILETELRLSGFDDEAIKEMIDEWIIPRLTGTYEDPANAGVMLPPVSNIDLLLDEVYEQDAFQERFPGYHARIEAGYNAIAIDDYLAYETSLKSLFNQYGLDLTERNTRRIGADDGTGILLSDAIIADLISSNISIDQATERIEQGVNAVLEAPQEVRDQFNEWYGTTGDTSLLMMFLDPEESYVDLQKKAGAAMAAGYAESVLGSISTVQQDLAEEIATLGLSSNQLYATYVDLASKEALYKEKIGEEDFTITDEGVSAAFGVDTEDVSKIENRRQSRVAAFSGGGGAFISGEGTGLGSA
jgi:hypothetical protein